MALQSPIMNLMVAAARKAARGLVRDFGEVEQLQVSKKGVSDFVTTADLKAEKTLVAELNKARPGYGFLLEEGGVRAGTDPHFRWIVDPLDGTLNFMHGIPHFAISIGLERDGEIVAGVIYQPVGDEMFLAEKGQGAWLNNRRLRVSARRLPEESLFATGIPFKDRPGHDEFLAQCRAVMAVSAGIRRQGSAALDLAYVAAGRYEGYWETRIHAWDMAAGILLVREAGGFVTDLAGGSTMLESGDIVAANQQMHPILLDLLAKAKP
ncbi:MAG: inositol monophosphatase [Rhodospirillales bacterium]|nr:inositol monophosphatase [Rhodospirillales bacterium]